LAGTVDASQRALSRPAHGARRARLFAGLSGWARTGLAAVQGGRSALWLAAVPAEGDGLLTIPGRAMRDMARLWLGAAARPYPPRPCCPCGAAADAAGRHFLGACPSQAPRRTGLHHFLVRRVAAALRRAPRWGAVVLEAPLDGSGGALRPDVRATEAATGAITWLDVSVAGPWGDLAARAVRTSPLRPAAAAAREGAKVAHYAPSLPPSNPPHTFAPVVWEALGRVGPASDRWLKAALAGPRLAVVRGALLRDVSVALWRSLAWATAAGYASCFAASDATAASPAAPSTGAADADDDADEDGVSLPLFLRGALRRSDGGGPIQCANGE